MILTVYYKNSFFRTFGGGANGPVEYLSLVSAIQGDR